MEPDLHVAGDTAASVALLDARRSSGSSSPGRRMAVKEWFRRLRPAPLYLMLAVTGLFFVTQLVMSHMTHALTLLVDSYHMLCNLIALAGCIITIKYGSASAEGEEEPGGSTPPPVLGCHKHDSAGCSEHHNNHHHQHHHTGSSSERRLKNTFGWARIDVLVMLIGCVFLNSLCFSLIVEALQTLIHIEHHDEMHHPIPVLVVATIGLLINALCYLFIGGYTFHQASFLHVTANGEVVLDHVMNQDSVRKGQRRLSAQSRRPPPPVKVNTRQGPWEMCRDVVGCLFVIVCALIVYFTDQKVAKFVDPLLSIVSAITLLTLSYPYMRESGSILLQTIPDTININSLRKELLKAFPDILNVHDLHVWRFTASRVFSTAHIIFLNNKDYSRKTKEITDFFHDQGITQVTIQPEFFQAENINGITALPNIHDDQCLVPCLGDGCYILHCCANNGYKLSTVSVVSLDDQKSNKGSKMSDSGKKSQPEMLQDLQNQEIKTTTQSELNENEIISEVQNKTYSQSADTASFKETQQPESSQPSGTDQHSNSSVSKSCRCDPTLSPPGPNTEVASDASALSTNNLDVSTITNKLDNVPGDSVCETKNPDTCTEITEENTCLSNTQIHEHNSQTEEDPSHRSHSPSHT